MPACGTMGRPSRARDVRLYACTARNYSVGECLTGPCLEPLCDATSMGVESEPVTTATPRMMRLLMNKVIPERYPKPFLQAREKLQMVIEGVGGCRIAEVCGAGDKHGILANNSAILEDLGGATRAEFPVVCELYIENSKTGFGRFMNVAGKFNMTDGRLGN